MEHLSTMSDDCIVKIQPQSLSVLEAQIQSPDIRAIHEWLGYYRLRSPQTVRSNKKEAMRFLMWLEIRLGTHERLLPMATGELANEYLEFLMAPKALPAHILQKYGYSGQPFRKPLGSSSIRQAIVILKQMFSDLRDMVLKHDQDPYVRINPFALIRPAPVPKGFNTRKALTQEEWNMVQETIELLPKDSLRSIQHYHRTRWLLQLMYRLWARRTSIANLRMSDFFPSEGSWMIQVQGKGSKNTALVASSKLIEELIVYRRGMGMPDLPTPSDTRPVIGAVPDFTSPITDDAIYSICKVIFSMTAERIEQSYPHIAAKIRNKSPHSMRHTGISIAVNKHNVPLQHAAIQAQHSSILTTAGYVTEDTDKLRKELEAIQ